MTMAVTFRLVLALDPLSSIGGVRMLLEDESVSAIMLNSDGTCWAKRAGTTMRVQIEYDRDHLQSSVQAIAQRFGVPYDYEHPGLNIDLPGGGELAVMGPPVSNTYPCITIHRFSDEVKGDYVIQ